MTILQDVLIIGRKIRPTSPVRDRFRPMPEVKREITDRLIRNTFRQDFARNGSINRGKLWMHHHYLVNRQFPLKAKECSWRRMNRARFCIIENVPSMRPGRNTERQLAKPLELPYHAFRAPHNNALHVKEIKKIFNLLNKLFISYGGNSLSGCLYI